MNALVALSILQHEFHSRTANWIRALTSAQPSSELSSELLTCSITELGFVRVLAQVSQYGLTLGQAQSLLLQVKTQSIVRFRFISDGHDVSKLPRWVKIPKQLADGHLAALAKAHGGVLATLDTKIPRAFLIPN